jgi:hypothetical protein
MHRSSFADAPFPASLNALRPAAGRSGGGAGVSHRREAGS